MQFFGAVSVIAQEIHSLAQFGDGVGPGLARLVDRERHEVLATVLQHVCSAAQGVGALSGGRPGPFTREGGCGGASLVNGVFICGLH